MSWLCSCAARRRFAFMARGATGGYAVPPQVAPAARRWLTSTTTSLSNAVADGSGVGGAGGAGVGDGDGGVGAGGAGGAGAGVADTVIVAVCESVEPTVFDTRTQYRVVSVNSGVV